MNRRWFLLAIVNKSNVFYYHHYDSFVRIFVLLSTLTVDGKEDKKKEEKENKHNTEIYSKKFLLFYLFCLSIFFNTSSVEKNK